jgi:hypothetical protein
MAMPKILRIVCIRLSTVLPVLGLLAGSGTGAYGQEYRTLMDLRGQWRFEIGDDKKWANPSFDDRDWVKIKVPGQWEGQGFPGYDGYAWYRKTITIPQEWEGKQLFLDLGNVDDVDETYINGYFMGFRGQFPPDYISAYNHARFYFLPAYCLRPGKENVIAVRVYDSELGGGIYRGEISIKEPVHPLYVDQELPSLWKFHTGDSAAWKSPRYDDDAWEDIHVPAYWETQGHKQYDGVGWYRVKFTVKPELKGERLILFLGKIDDVDETFLNGERIGKTGQKFTVNNADFDIWRAYTIPSERLSKDGENTLAVRVYDGYMHGGIYRGPIGLVRRDEYLDWEQYKGNKPKKKGWEKLMEWLFE